MRQRPTLELLEPRILYSADTPSALAGALVGTPDAEHRLLDAEGEFAAQTAPQEIVFIDARTPESAQLVEDIEAQSAREVEVIVLDAERNGLEQISEALAGRENVAALHFIAHGGEGVMQLGNTLVTADSLERNPGLVEAWGQVLTADADILLYGCDIAATAQGRVLADTLARLTGADVSASDNATGHASLGGDWNLEYTTGAIDVPVALSASAQDAWSHLLPSVVLTSYEPPFANLTDNAYPISAGTSYAQSFSVSGTGTYTVNQIDLVLYRNAVTAGPDINIQLRSALGGGGANLLASGSVSRAELSTSESWVVVSLDATATLSLGTTYYIRIQAAGGDGVFVGIDDAGTYADGNLLINGTAQPARDTAFRVIWNDGPVLDLNGNPSGLNASASFTEQTPVRIAQNGRITDPDSANLASLTATLTARPDGDAVESLSLNATAASAASGAGLSVTYTTTTGELSITGSATLATYQTILRGIQYTNTSDTPTTTNRVVSVVVSDGSTPSIARTSVITVTAVNDAPVNNVPAAQTTNEDTARVFSVAGSNAISITDDAGTNPVRVTLTGSSGVITLASIAGLTFTTGDGTADATMTFTGTVAAINTALDGMSFMPNAEFSGSASLTINTNDQGNTGTGGALSDLDTVAITVNAVNDRPVIAGAGGTLAYTEGNAATVIDASLTVSDVDDVNIESATVTISTGLVSIEDALSFTPIFGITGVYTAATGVLALSGSATLAQYEQVLESVTYQNINTFDPSTAARTITWVVNDGTDSSAGVISTITLAAVNDVPVNNVPGAQSTNEDTALVFSGGNAISITDDAGTNPVQVSLSGSNGVITLSGTAGLTFSAGDGTADGTMTFSGTVAAINAALNGLSFLPGADFNGAASLSINTNDQGNTGIGIPESDMDTVAITVTPVNDAPVLNAVQLTVNEGGTRVLAPADFNISDPDTGAFTYTVSALAGGSFEVFDGLTWNAAASFTTAQVAASAVRFVDDGDEVAPSFSITANDGAANSATIAGTVSYTPVNDAPVHVVPGMQTAAEDTMFVFSTGSGNPISVGDVDAGTNALQVVLTGTNGAVTLASIAGLTFSVGDGVADASMTFTGSAAAVNAALNGMSFMPAAGFSGAASLSIDTSDQGNTGAGGALSDSDVVDIDVQANVPPTVSASGGITVFTEGNNVPSTPVVVDGALTVSDPDSSTLASATISIGAGWQASEDVLAFASNPATMGNITGSYNAATGVLNLSSAGATATLAQWQTALRSVTYTNTSETPNTTARTVSFVVSGQGGASGASAQQVAVTSTNDAPIVSPSGGMTAFTGGGSPVVVDAGVALGDVDNATLASAMVWISGEFQAGQDMLGFSNDPATMGNIAGSYNAASGMLTLSSAGASATLSQWQAALRSVTYDNTAATPIVGARSVSFDVSDGTAGAMAAATHVVNVSPAPVAPDPGPIVPPPPVIPPVVVGPPPVTPPPTTTPPPSTQPTAGPSQPAASQASADTPIEPVSVDLAERPHNPMAVATADSSNAASTPAFRLAVYRTAVQSVQLTGGDLLGEVMRQGDSRGATSLLQLDEEGRSAGEVAVPEEFESLRDTLREQGEIQSRGTVALAAGSLSMTLAYLLWLIRGGALVASALSALPAWRILDPLPVLSRVNDDDEEEADEDDDQAIASFADEPVGARQ